MKGSEVTGAPRLLWVNHFAAAPDMGGGTRHVELGRELVRRGWSVQIAASDFHLHHREYLRRRDAADRSVIHERVDGVDMVWLWAHPYTRNDISRIRNWLSFGSSLSRLPMEGSAPQIVIGSTPHLFAALASWRLARRLGVPFVLEVRDLWPESLAVGGGMRGPGYWSLFALARFLYRVADGIIVLARGVGEYLGRLGVPSSRITLVPNGVDASAFLAAAPVEREPLRLVYAGAHGPANGLDAVLVAASRLRDDGRVSFLLVGDGPSKAELRDLATQRGLERVCFRDPVPKSEMPALLGDCDGGLMVLRELPLFSFGVSPNKLFDYWGASLPVICNVAGDVAGMLKQSGGGVQARDGSGEALADAIRNMLSMSPSERRAMGLRGRAWVTTERDRPVIAAKLEAAIAPLIGGLR
ncbi:MAG: glycosyltransferase family 4 protein [Gemmatimonadota bacterium]|nr:glycosyltransferase family 4 protein [Gemmatimonadota bacterium]